MDIWLFISWFLLGYSVLLQVGFFIIQWKQSCWSLFSSPANTYILVCNFGVTLLALFAILEQTMTTNPIPWILGGLGRTIYLTCYIRFLYLRLIHLQQTRYQKRVIVLTCYLVPICALSGMICGFFIELFQTAVLARMILMTLSEIFTVIADIIYLDILYKEYGSFFNMRMNIISETGRTVYEFSVWIILSNILGLILQIYSLMTLPWKDHAIDFKSGMFALSITLMMCMKIKLQKKTSIKQTLTSKDVTIDIEKSNIMTQVSFLEPTLFIPIYLELSLDTDFIIRHELGESSTFLYLLYRLVCNV